MEYLHIRLNTLNNIKDLPNISMFRQNKIILHFLYLFYKMFYFMHTIFLYLYYYVHHLFSKSLLFDDISSIHKEAY